MSPEFIEGIFLTFVNGVKDFDHNNLVTNLWESIKQLAILFSSFHNLLNEAENNLIETATIASMLPSPAAPMPSRIGPIFTMAPVKSLDDVTCYKCN